MKRLTSDRRNRPTKDGNAQRKKANRSRAKLPHSATRRRLKEAAADQEREEQLKEKWVALIKADPANAKLLPESNQALRQAVAEAMVEIEREEKLNEKVRFIERHGSAVFRLYLSDVITALANMVSSGHAANWEVSYSERELFLIAHTIRLSRAMAPGRATSYLRSFAQSLPTFWPARLAILKAIDAPKKTRDAMLDLIQIGGFRCVLNM